MRQPNPSSLREIQQLPHSRECLMKIVWRKEVLDRTSAAASQEVAVDLIRLRWDNADLDLKVAAGRPADREDLVDSAAAAEGMAVALEAAGSPAEDPVVRAAVAGLFSAVNAL